jgi:hypothetical protein
MYLPCYSFSFALPLTFNTEQGLNPAGELSKMTLADLRKKFSEGEDETQMLQVLRDTAHLVKSVNPTRWEVRVLMQLLSVSDSMA